MLLVTSSVTAYAANGVELSIVPSELGGIFSLTDKKDLLLSASNVPADIEEVRIALNCTDAYGKKADALPGSVVLRKKADYKCHLTLPARIGYYDVSCRYLADARRFSFAVIPNSTPSTSAIDDTLKANAAKVFVIGGSSLSPPDIPFNEKQPVSLSTPAAKTGFCDVGLRLAYTAPIDSIVDVLANAFKDPKYLPAR
jgi:hypothetical protein